MITKTYSVLHLFAGIGGGALGFQSATEEWKGLQGEFETLAGVDVDPEACADFETLTGAPAHCMDLFSRIDYIAFHGQEPPDGWSEVLPQDLLNATGGRCPDVIFTSPPCKGFSGLLPSKSAASAKYQALNQLTVRGIFLSLEAFRHDLPRLILLENVPRITSRGAKLLKLIKGMLESYGYVVSDGFHDCGEIGGLGQVRRRYLLIARQPDKIPGFVYKPRVQKHKTIGEVIGPLPMPDDPTGGPMHRLPRLKWKTWVRLALIPAGGDWRSLQDLELDNYRIEHIPRTCSFGVQDWDKPGVTVTGHARVGGSTAAAIADARINCESRPNLMGVADWEKPIPTVTGSASVSSSNGVAAVADVRMKTTKNSHRMMYRVCRTDEPAPTVTGSHGPNSGAITIADDRASFNHSYRIVPWDKEAGTITGGCAPSNGGACVADPRTPSAGYSNKYSVNKWAEKANCVTGIPDIQAGAPSVDDPRVGCRPRNGVYGVQPWDEPGKTVAGASDVHNTASTIADPRIPGDNEAPDPPPIIIALDGTWHRPLTTFELAMLQGFPAMLRDGKPLELTGNSQSRWRERIGNAVPPPAAQAMAETMLRALLPAEEQTWVLGDTPIWVKEEEHVHQ